ncbi:MAG TPA: peptide chain release factor N(5)-glutamine methyltransferase, partial [Bacteroidota bacterium]|nr:peptide chain release factor N(5)-glutamine methyltransferase [Bacteroidota bacterium]
MFDETETMMTVRRILNQSVQRLEEHGIESARLVAELLIAHATGRKRGELVRLADVQLTDSEEDRIESHLIRALANEPVQYIVGSTEFMGLEFHVDRRVLIPRPETEILVEKAIDIGQKNPAMRILDIGTGSGNIAISLAKFLPKIAIDSVDISAEALQCALDNARVHGVEQRIRFVETDLLSDNAVGKLTPKYDMIISNPPYISEEEYGELPANVRAYEPAQALSDSADGLTFYTRISDLSKLLLKSGGWLFVEVGYNQAQEVAGIFKQNNRLSHIEVFNDYNGVQRIV